MITSTSTWLFARYVNGKLTYLIPETINAAIQPGLNTSNTLLVRVKGAHFDFFINGTSVGEADDTTFSAGLMGVIGSQDDDVAFNNVQVATLT